MFRLELDLSTRSVRRAARAISGLNVLFTLTAILFIWAWERLDQHGRSRWFVRHVLHHGAPHVAVLFTIVGG